MPLSLYIEEQYRYKCCLTQQADDVIMETTFYIILNIKTATGFERYGRFSVGNDPFIADALFHKLTGSESSGEDCPLHLDFMETRNGLPVSLRVLSCNLQQLAENIKIITREKFKALNLGEK